MQILMMPGGRGGGFRYQRKKENKTEALQGKAGLLLYFKSEFGRLHRQGGFHSLQVSFLLSAPNLNMVLGYQRKPENSGKHLVKPTKLQSFYKLSFFLFLMYRNISLNSLRISDNSFGSYSPQLLPFPFFLFLQIHSLCCSYTLEYVGTGTWLTYQSHALKEN